MALVADITDDGKIIIAEFEWKYKELLKDIPSSSYKKEKWYFSLTWPTYLALKYTFKDNLVLSEDLQKWLDSTQSSVNKAMQLRSATEFSGYENLFPHQRADVEFLSLIKRGILANDMGTGKSQASFSAIRRLYEMGEEVFPCLVVGPNSTKHSWKREIEKVWPGLQVTVVDGSAAQRKKQLETPAHVYIMNWESLRSHSKLKPYGSISSKKCVECGGLDPSVKASACEAHEKELNRIQFKSAIGDEIHRCVDPKAKMARAFKAATEHAEIKFGLTGTPISGTPDDLFSILNWISPEAYPSKTKYLDRFCVTHYNAWGSLMVIGIKEDRKEEFFAGLDPILRRMPKEIVLQFLPPVLYERRDVEMNIKQKKAYTQMKEKMIAELDNGDILFTTSPLTKTTRLLQLASSSGEVLQDEVLDKETGQLKIRQKLILQDPSCKLDAFMEDLSDFGDDSVVVFAVSKQLINMLSARMTKAGIEHGLITGDQYAAERQTHMDNFQEGKIKYILCTISAGGTGITLTKGRVAVYLQRSWSMIENKQSEARVHRIGSEQHDSVLIIDYVTSGSCEEQVFEAVAAKNENLEEILRDKESIRKFLNA